MPRGLRTSPVDASARIPTAGVIRQRPASFDSSCRLHDQDPCPLETALGVDNVHSSRSSSALTETVANLLRARRAFVRDPFAATRVELISKRSLKISPGAAIASSARQHVG